MIPSSACLLHDRLISSTLLRSARPDVSYTTRQDTISRAAIVSLRVQALLPLEDVYIALKDVIPHLSRSSLHRCLQRQHACLIDVEIVRKPPDQVGFAVHPWRCVVERFFAWISRNRRLWKDPEATIASATAFLYAASIMSLVRRLGRAS